MGGLVTSFDQDSLHPGSIHGYQDKPGEGGGVSAVGRVKGQCLLGRFRTPLVFSPNFSRHFPHLHIS